VICSIGYFDLHNYEGFLTTINTNKNSSQYGVSHNSRVHFDGKRYMTTLRAYFDDRNFILALIYALRIIEAVTRKVIHDSSVYKICPLEFLQLHYLSFSNRTGSVKAVVVAPK